MSISPNCFPCKICARLAADQASVRMLYKDPGQPTMCGLARFIFGVDLPGILAPSFTRV